MWTEAAFFNRSKSEISEQNWCMLEEAAEGQKVWWALLSKKLPIEVSVLFLYLHNLGGGRVHGSPCPPPPSGSPGRGVCRRCVARSSRHATEKITCIIFCFFNIKWSTRRSNKFAYSIKKISRLTKKFCKFFWRKCCYRTNEGKTTDE